jgi:hypothetical protein
MVIRAIPFRILYLIEKEKVRSLPILILKGIKPENLTRENQMKFTQKEVEKIGAEFYWNKQVGSVDCAACKAGQHVEFEPVGFPVLGVQPYKLTCGKCRRTGRHPN